MMLRPNKIDDEDSVAWPKAKCGMRVLILFKKKKGKCGIFQIYFILMKMYVAIIINRFLIIKVVYVYIDHNVFSLFALPQITFVDQLRCTSETIFY